MPLRAANRTYRFAGRLKSHFHRTQTGHPNHFPKGRLKNKTAIPAQTE
ncbi:hypothetical protein [Neisseria sp.]